MGLTAWRVNTKPNEGTRREETARPTKIVKIPLHRGPCAGRDGEVNGRCAFTALYCWPTGAGSVLPAPLSRTLLFPNEAEVPVFAKPVLLFIMVTSARLQMPFTLLTPVPLPLTDVLITLTCAPELTRTPLPRLLLISELRIWAAPLVTSIP